MGVHLVHQVYSLASIALVLFVLFWSSLYIFSKYNDAFEGRRMR